MSPRRIQPAETPPDLPAEKAYAVLKTQLAKLEDLKGQNYQQIHAAEVEWLHLTEKLIIRFFGSASTNLRNFKWAQDAGEHYIVPYMDAVNPGLEQSNFNARVQAYEGCLRSRLEELELDLPDSGIKGAYEPGEEYEFYRDVTA